MPTPTRRRFLAASGLAAASVSGCLSDSTAQTDITDLELTGTELASDFTSPVGVAVPQSETYYIADQTGDVSFVDGAGADPVTAIDISDRMVPPSGERGLLGIAVHPEYDGSGRVYLRYSAPARSETPSNYSHTFVLSEFEMASGSIDSDSERPLLEIPEPQSNHNAGSVAFGPDGYLYVGVGDGGGGNDQGEGHVEDWYDDVAGGNGQDITANLLGSVLRIDVEEESEDRPYGIPDDNPLVGRDGLDEQYAWGFRNPWRFSFGPGGRLFVADVGQSDYEEVNVVERGGNYGWNVREGTHCFMDRDCPTTGPDGDPLQAPIIEYPHDGGDVSGVSVIGGYLYDGDDIQALQDRYVFADYVASGQLFVATEGDTDWSTTTVPITGSDIGTNVLSFGRTPAGELLLCTADTAGGDATGALHRIQTV